MAKISKYGCKKCGTVIEIETQLWPPDRLEFRIKEGGKFYDGFKGTEIQCKKCNNTVLVVQFSQT